MEIAEAVAADGGSGLDISRSDRGCAIKTLVALGLILLLTTFLNPRWTKRVSNKIWIDVVSLWIYQPDPGVLLINLN
jgi:hypothetical protein